MKYQFLLIYIFLTCLLLHELPVCVREVGSMTWRDTSEPRFAVVAKEIGDLLASRTFARQRRCIFPFFYPFAAW